MNFTINDIEDSARTILLDTDSENYRYTPREMFIAIRDGMKQLRGIRPETRYVNGELTDVLLKTSAGADQDFTIPTDASGYSTFRTHVINMEDRWQEALVYYVVFRMYLKDDPDTINNEQAKNYLSMFERSAQS